MKKPTQFTLIELLVVIAIIGVLISMLFPALSKGRAAARQVVCASNEKQMAIGMASYTTTYGVFPRSAYDSAVGDGTGQFGTTWSEAILAVQGFDTFTDFNGNTYGQLFVCPSAPATHPTSADNGRDFKLCYQINEQRNANNGNWNGIGRTNEIDWRSAATIVSPSEMIAIADVEMTSFSYREANTNNVRYPSEFRPTENINLYYFHDQVNNFLFVDGHVKAMRIENTIGTGSMNNGKGYWRYDGEW